MTNILDERLKNADWWRLNKFENALETIEWTYYNGGWVRAKIDSIDTWHYKECKSARYAISLGEQIIWEQKQCRRR